VTVHGTGGARESVLRRTFIAQQQAEAVLNELYAIRPIAAEELGARHPGQRFTVRFDRTGARFATPQPVEPWRLGGVAVGCDSEVTPFGNAVPRRTDRANRIEYGREVRGAKLSEWYVNGPLGIEQGFTLESSPCGSDSSRLAIHVAVDGLKPLLRVVEGATRAERKQVELADAAGAHRATYGDWFAVDAVGRELELALEVRDQRLILSLDTAGAIWPIVIDPLIWLEQERLTASDGVADDRFGYSMARSGDTAAIGAWGDDSMRGAAYVFVRSGTIWSQQAKLTASDGLDSDRLGWSVAASGNTVLLGNNKGGAYVFVRSGTTWVQQQKLVSSDGAAALGFGRAVALSGNTALVGADDYDAVYVFVRSGTTWTEQKKLTPSASAAGSRFGASVALDGDVAVVGTPEDKGNWGAAYGFYRSGTVWQEDEKFTATDNAEWDQFGFAVALSGNTAVISAPSKAGNTGAAYAFVRSGTDWSQQKKWTGPVEFAVSVAISGDRAIAASDTNAATLGRVSVFDRVGTEWTTYDPPLGKAGAGTDRLGRSLALGSDSVLAGSDVDNANRGAVYVFGFGSAPGDACAGDAECASLHCVEGVCCDTACQGTCTSCLAARTGGVQGICSAVTANTDPRNHCSASAQSTCGNSGVCDGQGACALYAQGVECAAAGCPTARSENPPDTCSGGGSCQVTGVEACQTGYLCVAGACKTSCASASDCDAAGDYACIGGACIIPLGTSCGPNDVCQNGNCVDGVCCSSECAGKCEACVQARTGEPDGHCAPIPAGQDPQNECPIDPGYPDSCKSDGFCDGARACRDNAIAGTACGATTCNNGQVSGLTCDGSGTCDTDTVGCGVYECNGAACGTSCDSDADCDAQLGYCVVGGTCAPKKSNGAACTEARECDSQHCVEGVCCDTSCNSGCVSCLGSRKAEGPNGTCGGLPSGTQCVAAGSDPSCVTSLSQDPTDVCDGSGFCTVTHEVECGVGYACVGSACKTNCVEESDCDTAAGYSCLAGACQISTGGACGPGDVCESGHCTDGVCCDQACTGQCEACSEPGRAGTCVTVSGQPRGDREACDDFRDPDCAARCDGDNRSACQFVPANTSCGTSACSDETEQRSSCDGQGRCQADEPRKCAPYACGESACLESCSKSTDCSAGNGCKQGDCVAGSASCSEDLSEAISADGVPEPCAPYLCDVTTSSCPRVCTSSTDCSSGFLCDPVGRKCELATTKATEDGGCGCRIASAKPSSSLPSLCWLALGLLLTRRATRFRRCRVARD
jgi:hypothetical protein